MKSLCPVLIRRAVSAAACAAVLSVATPYTLAQGSVDHWVGTWSTAEVGRPQTPPAAVPGPPPFMQNQCPAGPPPASTFLHFNNQTIRQIVHVSLGGPRVRVVLSNRYGTAPLTVGAAQVALAAKGAAIQGGSNRPLTFSGRPTFTIPPGAIAHSDAVELIVPDMTDLAIDLYLPGDTNTPAPLTTHLGAFQTNYVSGTGNHVGSASFPIEATTQSWFVLHRVEVTAPRSTPGLVTYGDSITDGTRSTPNTNNRWPDHLARRVLAAGSPVRVAIMNQGIAGNRVLSNGNFNSGINALARFEENVLSMPGATHVVFMEGINDIGQGRENPTPTAEDIIAGHKQIIERAHAKGLKIYGATLTAFYGAAYYTEVGDRKRAAVNEWIRTSKAYDGVIDFDKVTRDPADPKRFLAAFDSCDHLHPSDAGYKAMADAIDLAMFGSAMAAPQRSGSAAR
jgi:lysophospholipase L1-like esterase